MILRVKLDQNQKGIFKEEKILTKFYKFDCNKNF